MTLEQLIIAEIERRSNKKNEPFKDLEEQIKRNAIKERLKSKMDIYMMCRCF